MEGDVTLWRLVRLYLVALVAMTAAATVADGTPADGWAQATMGIAFAVSALSPGRARRRG